MEIDNEAHFLSVRKESNRIYLLCVALIEPIKSKIKNTYTQPLNYYKLHSMCINVIKFIKL